MSMSGDDIEVLECGQNNAWKSVQVDLNKVGEYHVATQKVSRIVFINAGELKSEKEQDFETTKRRHQQIQRTLSIPAAFWNKTHQDASGFFRATEKFDDDDNLEVHESWLRLQAKHAFRKSKSKDTIETLSSIDYHWDRLGFFIRWWPSSHFTVYCFDLPSKSDSKGSYSPFDLQAAIRDFVRDDRFSPSLPSAIHAMLIEQCLPLFDRQVWECRNLIREHEKNRPLMQNVPANKRPQPNYEDLHEIARHAIHSTEMLQTALHVLDAVAEEHKCGDLVLTSKRAHLEIERQLRYHKTILQGFEGRSRALGTRLTNEMQLTFHLNSQYDSIATGVIAQSSSEDSAAMRTISFLGLIFLPGTFISAVFSMSFFNFNPPNDAPSQEWKMSSKFWIFWVIAIPVTGITIVLWQWWHNRTRDSIRRTNTFYIKDDDGPGTSPLGGFNLRSMTGKRQEPVRSNDVEKGWDMGANWASYASSRSSASGS